MKRLVATLALGMGCFFTGCGPATGVSDSGVSDSAASNPTAPTTVPVADSGEKIEKVVKTDAEWKKILTPDQYYILREKGTEAAFKNAYFDNHEKGVYYCAGCDLELFSSEQKFESGTGWPSYWAPSKPGHVYVSKDSDGDRDELACARCGGHLGHVFSDGPKPTGQRYCIDSGALKFVKSK